MKPAFKIVVAGMLLNFAGTIPIEAEDAAAWGKPPTIPTESAFLKDRLEEPQNHFLLDGEQGFISGREFYQSTGEVPPFLWATQPFFRIGPDRCWQSDSLPLVIRAQGGYETEFPGAFGDIGWEALDGLRLHAGFDQMEEFSSRTYTSRAALAGSENQRGLAWVGENLPLTSQANAGGSFEHRGAVMAVQANQGWWWTASPVSGKVYPWEGYNAELVYKVGDDFDLSLVDQEWDSPISRSFYHAHWGRSELNMGFSGALPGAWVWRLDLGFQRKEMISDSVFAPYVEKTYPTRFRYRQNWKAPDSLPVQMISQGSMGFRDRILALQHSSEFAEKWSTHQVRQIFKGYYRHPMTGYKVPTETFVEDTSWLAQSKPGMQARGFSSELEYREKRKTFEVGISGNHVLEWEAPVFHLENLNTIHSALIRTGAYTGSSYLLQNASMHVFVGGGFGNGSENAKATGGFWRLHAGGREFWGQDAGAMEFLPSKEWAGGGGGWTFPHGLKLDAQVNFVGEKEVRGWGPTFQVPAHFENNLALSKSLWDDQLKLSLSAMHAFGEDIREQPNGNPLRFHVLAGIEGAF